MATDWREFEKLVARIEEALVPQGAIVKSPDRLRDLVTGQLREVDASIRFNVGSTPVLITIECRKRKGVQDDTWIEQLATKKVKLGAAKTIAVSATGFTTAAAKTARLHGIELRTLKDRIDEELVQHALAGIRISIIVTEYETQTIAFQLADGSPLPAAEFAEELSRALEGDKAYPAIAIERHTGKAITVAGILDRVDVRTIPEDGTPVMAVAKLEVKPDSVLVSTRSGPKPLRSIEISARFTKRVVPAPPESLLEYASLDQPIRRTVRAVADISDSEALEVTMDVESPSLDSE